MDLIKILLLMGYALVAGVHIYILLVQGWKHTGMEYPWIYIACGALWPLLAAPAMGYILAHKWVNGQRRKEERK